MNIFPYLDVLAIDDINSSLILLKAKLRLAGFVKVDIADGALAAAQMMSRFSYNIVFVVLEMEEICGF